MATLQFNIGSSWAVTAPSSSATDLEVTVAGQTFTEEFDSDEATTAANFVASHGAKLNKLGILAVVSGNDVVFYGVNRKFETTNTAVETSAADRGASYGFDTVTIGQPSTANVVTMTLLSGGTTVTTASVTYKDAASALADQARLNHIVSLKDSAPVGPVRVSRATNATFA